ncbi:MAG: hypothetical protein GX125_05390 [Bacteroidales bacterium]|jgi:hypothetical protein|nr:PHB depolymerase family esterase [Bacteroidota bacterium]NLN99679.1 hypothetical protein [Bacteroidales bacterium]
MRRTIIFAIVLAASLSLMAQPPQRGEGNVPGRGPMFQQTPDPENVAYAKRAGFGSSTFYGRSSNYSPTFFIYPDTKLDKDAAEALVKEMISAGIDTTFHVSAYVINPIGDKYDNAADFESFKTMFNRARSGNLKVIGIGNGATFVNAVIAPQAADHLAGILTIGGKPAKAFKGQSYGVPAYVAGKNADKVARNYKAFNAAHADESLLQVVVNSDADASLPEIFNDCWEKVFSTCFRYNNYKHTHYMGATFGQYGPYELEPFTIWERMNIERKVVTVPQGSGNNQSLPYLWYEYWPKELMNGAPERSVPVMVLLHGNANDPRTQAETSGFLEVAGKERFFVVEMEWQGSRTAAAMGHDGVESVIYWLLGQYPQLDPSRIYAEGLSAGSMTATQLGIRKSHLFTAVGGHSGALFGSMPGQSARPNPFSNYQSIMAEATQKRGAVEIPYCSVFGTADDVVPFFTPDNWKGNSYLNAWNVYQIINGIDVVKDLDFSKDPLFGMTLRDREVVTTNKGEGIKMEMGQLYKGDMPIIKICAVVDYGHWNFKPTAQVMWDFFKQFSRDPETGKLIYHAE